MSNWCSAVFCTNNSNTTPKVSFHRFPSDSSLCKQWVTAVRRKNWEPKPSSRLCSAHFTDDCYDATDRLMGEFGIRRGYTKTLLKPGSVPTIFKHSAGGKPQKPPIQRGAYAKRRRKEVRKNCMLGCVREYWRVVMLPNITHAVAQSARVRATFTWFSGSVRLVLQVQHCWNICAQSEAMLGHSTTGNARVKCFWLS